LTLTSYGSKQSKLYGLSNIINFSVTAADSYKHILTINRQLFNANSYRGDKEMKNTRKIATIVATIFLITLMGGGALTAVPPAKAALPPLISTSTYAFIDVAPDPVGVGQTVVANAWLIEFDPLTSIDNGQVWQGYQITVTRPDHTTDILGPYAANAAAGIGATYTPT